MTDPQSNIRAIGIAAEANQFLTFNLAGEEFGIDILRVQEIKGITKIKPLPNLPAHIKGLLNLRGKVIPIVDMRTKFSLPNRDYDRFSVIIVVVIDEHPVGLAVDAVSEVLDFASEQIEPAPRIAGADTAFMDGIAKTDERMITLLNLDQLIATEVLQLNVAS
ncbi:Chemotaxis protein CheW [Stieleria bergensis]|uniref:Chemotaxis protein CheW n=1 Tax=Stieleria bergensis TaxID=2528025 RepID=A0A517SW59_9BACT|nr:MAG: hypothetical protein CBB71_20600 [Rhodopirellula sp. TMED11]QDT60369.1 Chemotaxis protein CheW [Planctomycetes bacterium SV_7m_r]